MKSTLIMWLCWVTGPLFAQGAQQLLISQKIAAGGSNPAVQHSCANSGFSTTITCAIGTPSGNEIVVMLNYDGSTTWNTPTGTNCGTWSLVNTATVLSETQAVYKSTGAGGGSCTISASTSSGGSNDIYAVAWDISNYTALDATNPAFSSDGTFCTSCTTASFTTGSNNSLVLWGIFDPGTRTVSAFGTFTLDNGTNQTSFLAGNAHFLLATAGATSSTFTKSGTSTWLQGIMAVH